MGLRQGDFRNCPIIGNFGFCVVSDSIVKCYLALHATNTQKIIEEIATYGEEYTRSTHSKKYFPYI